MCVDNGWICCTHLIVREVNGIHVFCFLLRSESTHRRRNREFLCEFETMQCSRVQTPFHVIQFAAIYCCHQTTNFFAQYASACYVSRNCASFTCCCCLRLLLRYKQAAHLKSNESCVHISCTCVHVYSSQHTHKMWISLTHKLPALFFPKSFRNEVERQDLHVFVYICVRAHFLHNK